MLIFFISFKIFRDYSIIIDSNIIEGYAHIRRVYDKHIVANDEEGIMWKKAI